MLLLGSHGFWGYHYFGTNPLVNGWGHTLRNPGHADVASLVLLNLCRTAGRAVHTTGCQPRRLPLFINWWFPTTYHFGEGFGLIDGPKCKLLLAISLALVSLIAHHVDGSHNIAISLSQKSYKVAQSFISWLICRTSLGLTASYRGYDPTYNYWQPILYSPCSKSTPLAAPETRLLVAGRDPQTPVGCGNQLAGHFRLVILCWSVLRWDHF